MNARQRNTVIEAYAPGCNPRTFQPSPVTVNTEGVNDTHDYNCNAATSTQTPIPYWFLAPDPSRAASLLFATAIRTFTIHAFTTSAYAPYPHNSCTANSTKLSRKRQSHNASSTRHLMTADVEAPTIIPWIIQTYVRTSLYHLVFVQYNIITARHASIIHGRNAMRAKNATTLTVAAACNPAHSPAPPPQRGGACRAGHSMHGYPSS